jgi:hypothetical protein
LEYGYLFAELEHGCFFGGGALSVPELVGFAEDLEWLKCLLEELEAVYCFGAL